MLRSLILGLLALVPAGCLTPITGRLDQLNEQFSTAQQHLVSVNGQITEANQRIASLQGQLGEANQRLVSVETKLGQTNARLEEANVKLASVERSTKTVEEGVKKVTGVKPP